MQKSSFNQKDRIFFALTSKLFSLKTYQTNIKENKRMSKKRKAAIILFILQGLGYLGASFSGSLSGAGFFELIGYNVFAIVGVILLISDKKKSN